VDRAKRDCQQFRRQNRKLLAGLDEAQCGHDFWLTRNGHGTGYWDRGYPAEIGEQLTKACEASGECNLVVGDDRKLYFEGGKES
jgi:hypothetical protein